MDGPRGSSLGLKMTIEEKLAQGVLDLIEAWDESRRTGDFQEFGKDWMKRLEELARAILSGDPNRILKTMTTDEIYKAWRGI